MSVSEQVRSHYDAAGLTDRIKVALADLAPEDAVLEPEQLAGLDQFHTRGLAATLDLARDAGVQHGEKVLDVGCGIGGPARLLAARFGVQVQGIDLSPAFIEAARYLTTRCGLQDTVQFDVADAAKTRFAGGHFDAVFLQHVAMNISDRASLYSELRRVLKSGGRFATYDVCRAQGEPYYPVPWARSSGTSFLLTADETVKAICTAGFRVRLARDEADRAKRFFEESTRNAPPAGPTLSLVMGSEFRTLAANLARSIAEDRLTVFAGVFEAV